MALRSGGAHVGDAKDPTERTALLIGALAILAVLLAMAIFLNIGTYDVAVSLVVLLALTLASVPVFRSLAEADGDPQLLWILLVGLLAKMVFSVGRYWMVTKLYGGAGDSTRYDEDGWIFAQQVRAGSIFPSIESIDSVEDATRRIIKLNGYLYAVVGRSKFAGFFVFSWFAFWGCVLFARGAKRAFPEMDHRRYLILVLFWPSLLFWPSAIGKDAIMLFCLGVASYGASVVLAPKARIWGLAVFAAGVGGMLLIRTHVALMAVLAVAVATAFAFIGGTKADDAKGRGRMVRVVGLVVMVLLALTAMTQTTRFFSEEAGEATSSTQALELTVERTQQGGSQFEPIVVTNPAQVPAATVSVLFRPFPWEARSAGTLISAAEGAIIALLFVLSWKRLLRWPGSAWRRPILIYGVMYCLMFVVAFSSIGNAGILARQRVQMLPLLFLAFAVPARRWWKQSSAAERESKDARPMVANSMSAGSVETVNVEEGQE